MVTGVTTEWDDIQVKNGVYKALEKVPTGAEIFKENIDLLENYDRRMVMNSRQLEELAEEDIDFDDEDDFMKQYRAKRVQEMQVLAAKPKFGHVFEITKPDWEHHVNQAPADTHVVICLYQPR